MEWSDQLGSRSRRAWLLFVKDGKVYPFKGEGIPGVVAVRGSSYRRNGKWSHTTYRLEVAQGARHISGKEGWETGRFAEGLASATGMRAVDLWVEMANALGVTVPAAQEFLRAWRPKAAEHIDAAEAALEELDEAAEKSGSDGATEAAISFGSPTNRVMRAGFWDWPVTVTLNGETVGTVSPSEGGWYSPVCEGLVRIIECVRSSGYHGGSVSLRLAVPEGAEVHHRQPEEPEEVPLPVEEPQPEPEPRAPATLADLKARFNRD